MSKILMDQADNGGGASGSPEGAADGAGAGAAGGAGGADGGTGSQAAGTQGQHQAGADADQIEIVYNGQKMRKTRGEVIALAQQGYDYTQKSQSLAEEKKQIAQSRKDYQARLLRLDQIEAEMKAGKTDKNGEGGEGQPDPNEPVKQLDGKLTALEQKMLVRDWEQLYYGPVKHKFPDISEDFLVSKFGEMIKAGEVDDTAEGLMKTAEAIANGFESSATSRLDKLLADPENPKIKAHNAKVIADYVANKTKLADAGGDKGAGGTGAKAKGVESISEVAARVRAGI